MATEEQIGGVEMESVGTIGSCVVTKDPPETLV